MGKTVLVVFLLQGSDVMYDVEIRTTLVFSVVAEVIGKAVFKLSYGCLRIVGDPFLCLQSRHHQAGKDEDEQMS